MIEVDPERKGAWVRVIPRLDTQTAASRGARPQAKLFQPRKYKAVRRDDARFGPDVYLHNKMKFKNGFLYKFFGHKNLISKNVVPPTDIFQKFQASGNFDDEEEKLEDL